MNTGRRRRRIALPAILRIAPLALAAISAACGTGEVDPGAGSPTPTPTPTATATPTPSATPTPPDVPRHVVIASTAGGLAHANHAALFRMKSAGAPIACDWVRIDAGDPFPFTISSAGVLEQGRTYDVIELVLSADGNIAFDAGIDHALSHPPVTVTSDLALTFHHDDPTLDGWVGGASETALPPGFSWADGVGCPGDSQ